MPRPVDVHHPVTIDTNNGNRCCGACNAALVWSLQREKEGDQKDSQQTEASTLPIGTYYEATQLVGLIASRKIQAKQVFNSLRRRLN